MNIQGIGQVFTAYQPESVSSDTQSLEYDVQSIISEEDSNGDGFLTIDETVLSEDMFSDFDADGDGLLTAEEIEAMEPPAQPPEGGDMVPGEEDDSAYDTLISALESSEQTGRENEQNLLQTMAMRAYQDTLAQAMNFENEYDTTGQSELLQILA